MANIMQQVREDEAAAAYMRSAASNALLAGDINMASTLFGGASGAISSGMFGGGTPGISGTPNPAAPYTTGAPY